MLRDSFENKFDLLTFFLVLLLENSNQFLLITNIPLDTLRI